MFSGRVLCLVVEGGQRVFVKSFGCSSNVADGEFMVGCLLNAGFDVVDRLEDADVLVYNTCVVKTPTENRIIEILRDISVLGKRLIVTGCLPMINYERLKREIVFDGVLGPSPGAKIVEAVKKVLSGEQFAWLNVEVETKPCLELPKRAVNPLVSIVPVAFGCLGACNYCCVVFARGRLRSCKIEDIVGRIRKDLDSGVREIWLTGQDVACYGQDIGVSLVDLLHKICQLKDTFFVRVGMMTPNHVLSMLPELIEEFRDKHIFKFLHLPIQSGDDEVLKLMNRFYSVDDFKRIVEAFRGAIPNVSVETDVICGFPGESSEAFERTIRLIEDVKPDVVNISKFFPRPKTVAEKMKPQVPAFEVKERSRKMADLVGRISFDKNKAWMTWEGEILVDERGQASGSWIGRNLAYKPIVIKNYTDFLLGKFLNVRVIRAFRTYLEAEI
jgi:MiaB-like tRNA modifying enzyme